LLLYLVCLYRVADRLKPEQPLDERMKNEFMLQQLVSLISTLDLSDELSRYLHGTYWLCVVHCTVMPGF